ncbi:MAG: ISNCY family transposase [Ghiorsea sp.]|nr:ISNCY family transposase [Ghiorsea sp.]
MKAELLQMSEQEQSRSEVKRLYIEGHIRQKSAAKRMGISTRQTRRIAKAYRQHGVTALIHGNRGTVSNRKIRDEIKLRCLALVRSHYHDFGPTFAAEKLLEKHQISISSETLRQWMISGGIWKAKCKKEKRHHPVRERRPRMGELIQVDGTPHDWFEGKAAKCTLMVFIDDATSKLVDLQFYPTEGTQAYMEGLRRYIKAYGRPVAIYSDRHSSLTVNTVDAASGEQLTQFGRALKTLDIEHIKANSPQAKGRVERANLTLQDRLLKEMRLEGTSNIEEGNAFLATYMEKHNQKFAVVPASSEDADRPVLHSEEELDLIFSKHSKRKLSKNLALQYNNTTYQVNIKGIGYAMRGATVTICETFDGKVTLLYKGKPLQYTTFKRGDKIPKVVSEKSINQAVDQAMIKQSQRCNHKPKPDHLWRKPIPQKRTFLPGAKEDISTLG